jgi:hypothetical protein
MGVTDAVEILLFLIWQLLHWLLFGCKNSQTHPEEAGRPVCEGTVWSLSVAAEVVVDGRTFFSRSPRWAREVRRSNPLGSISPLFCFELFQPIGHPGGAEVAGMTIPEQGHIPIPLQTAPVGAIQINGIKTLPQPHRRSRLSCIRGTLVKKTGRGDIACREQPIAAR